MGMLLGPRVSQIKDANARDTWQRENNARSHANTKVPSSLPPSLPPLFHPSLTMPIRPPVAPTQPPPEHTNKPTHTSQDQEQLSVGLRQETGAMGAGEGEPALVQ
jgi:hypothetical protein